MNNKFEEVKTWHENNIITLEEFQTLQETENIKIESLGYSGQFLGYKWFEASNYDFEQEEYLEGKFFFYCK